MTQFDSTVHGPIALCGLGNMGAAIASQLAGKAEVLAYDLDLHRGEQVCDQFALTRCSDLVDLARAKTVILCLPSPAISRQVAATLMPSMASGSHIIETGTVNPQDVYDLVEMGSPHGVGVVDAAIAAGVGQMTAGTAALLVGGDDQSVTAVQPVLDAFSTKVVRLGATGSGAALKVINNAVAHAVMVVLVEAIALAEASGIPRDKVTDLMTGHDAGLTRPLEHRVMERIAGGDYAGGMSTDAARKDSTLALALAQTLRVPIFAIQASHVVYELSVADGNGRLDYASIAKLWEGWLGTSLSLPKDRNL